MGFLKLFEKKSTSKIGTKVETPFKDTDTLLTYQQIEDAKLEVIKLNALLKSNKYTAHLKMNPEKITADSYIRLTPYTEKTKKPSKFPKMIAIFSTMYLGYSVILYYMQNEDIGKGTINISTSGLSYTIDLKLINNQLTIVKIVTTDRNYRNEKLYHIQSDGTVFER